MPGTSSVIPVHAAYHPSPFARVSCPGAPARAGAEIRGEVLAALAVLRTATPAQLHQLLLPHQEGTDHTRRALCDLAAEKPPLVVRTARAQQSIWCCTRAGLEEAAGAGVLPAPAGGKSSGRGAAAKTVLREHGLAGARDKLVQMEASALRTAAAVDLGMPTFTKIARHVSAT